jgi:hypothetical protein
MTLEEQKVGNEAGMDDEEEIDENDPLWRATLKIANGDREKALKMLEDPDALMKNPEVLAILDSSEDDVTEEWEKTEVDKTGTTSDTDVKVGGDIQESRGGSKNLTSSSAMKAGDDEDEEENQNKTVVMEGDPREHLNLVFIGHVDAGKSTLSGSILYHMGKVDSRTIERFEREAKQRNRESWFLAFIMDTSEEERAKGKTVIRSHSVGELS